jgi:hypothetical protein
MLLVSIAILILTVLPHLAFHLVLPFTQESSMYSILLMIVVGCMPAEEVRNAFQVHLLFNILQLLHALHTSSA